MVNQLSEKICRGPLSDNPKQKRGNGLWSSLTLRLAMVLLAAAPSAACLRAARAAGRVNEKELDRTIARGLDWLASRQSTHGHWTAPEGRYPTAMTALSATALLCEGSTTTQGKYAAEHPPAVDYLVDRQPATNGLIGDPRRRPLHLRPRLLHALSLPSARRGGGRRPPQGTDRRAHQRGRVHRPGPNGGRRLGLRQRQGRQRLRRRFDHHHAGARSARLPQRRHSRAQGDHRQGHQLHSQTAPAPTAA